MRYFFHCFLVIPTNFRHSFGHPQNETPHKHRAQPSRNALFFRSTAPLSAKCSAAPETAANTKTACRTFPSADGLQLRQRESNTRWGSQSPLPYRLAMAHCRKYKYSRMFPICQAKTSLTKPARSLMIKEKRKGDGLWAPGIMRSSALTATMSTCAAPTSPATS